MDTRTKIVETASRLFFTQGYNLTGINQIIDEAGIAKATLYQHFRSKEDVLVAYIEEAAKCLNVKMEQIIQSKPTAKEKVLAVFDYLLLSANSSDFGGCSFSNIAAQVPPDNVRIWELIKKQKDMTRSLFRRILTPVEKEDLADELYLLFDSALAATRIHRAEWPVHCAKKAAEKLI